MALKGGSALSHMVPRVELVPNLIWIKRRTVLDWEFMQKKPHQNPSRDSDPAVESKHS